MFCALCLRGGDDRVLLRSWSELRLGCDGFMIYGSRWQNKLPGYDFYAEASLRAPPSDVKLHCVLA
jgi:hypothetical protein